MPKSSVEKGEVSSWMAEEQAELGTKRDKSRAMIERLFVGVSEASKRPSHSILAPTFTLNNKIG